MEVNGYLTPEQRAEWERNIKKNDRREGRSLSQRFKNIFTVIIPHKFNRRNAS